MFNLHNIVFKFLVRIFLNLTKPFRKISVDKPVGQCKVDEHHHAKQHQLKCEELLRRYLDGMDESQQQRICQNMLYVRSVSYSQPDANNPKARLEDYENGSISTLERQCDEMTKVIPSWSNEHKKLNSVSTRSKQSDDDLKRSLEKSRAEYQAITSDLTAATQTVNEQANTIEQYENFCSELLSEIKSIIGQQHESCYDSLSRSFFHRTLCNAIMIRTVLGGDGYETDDRCADFDAISKLQLTSSAVSVRDVGDVQDSCTQTDTVGSDRQPYRNRPDFTSVGVQTESCRVVQSVGVQTHHSRVGESIGVQTDSVVQSAVGFMTDTMYCQAVGVQTSSGPGGLDGAEDDSSNIDIVTELLEKFGHDTCVKTNRYNLKILLTKVQTHGFQRLMYQELAFLHRCILAQSANYFTKYTPLLELARKKFPSLKSNTAKYKYDIVHIFATLDMVLEIKNKEFALEKISSTANKNKLKATIDEQTKKRISAKNKMFEVKAHNA